jgi:hypothetical protein
MPLGRPKCTLEDKVKIDLKGKRMGWCRLYSCGSGWGQMTGSCEHNIGKYLNTWLVFGFLRAWIHVVSWSVGQPTSEWVN